MLLPLIVSEPPPVGKAPPPKRLDKAMDEPFRTSIVSALITTLAPFPGPNRFATMPALPDMEKRAGFDVNPGRITRDRRSKRLRPIERLDTRESKGKRCLRPGDSYGIADLNVYLATGWSN